MDASAKFYELTPPEKKFKKWMNVWGIYIGIVLIGTLLIAALGLKSTAYLGNPIFFALTIGGLSGTFYAIQTLRDGVRENAYFADILIGTTLLAAVIMAAFLRVTDDTLTQMALVIGLLVGVGSAALTWIFAVPIYDYRIGRGFISCEPVPFKPESQAALTPAQKRLGQWAVLIAAVGAIASGLIIALQLGSSEASSRIGNPLFVAGSGMALVMVMASGLFVRWRPRWRLMMGDMLVTVLVMGTLTLFVATAFDWTGDYSKTALWLLLGFTVVTIVVRLAAEQSVYSGLYIPFWLFRELEAFAEVIIEGPLAAEKQRDSDGITEVVTPQAVAMNVDRYLSRVHSPRKLSAMISLLFVTFLRPLWGLHLSMSRMGYLERRQFIEYVFRRGRGIYRPMIQIKQLIVLGYYSDPRTYSQVGFEPFPKRPRYQNLIAADIPITPAVGPETTLNVVREREHHCKICVIGSGAGGAVAAARLAQAFPGEVTILEAGSYLRASQFTQSEPDMIAALYKDGGMQISMELNMPVLQGACVGGSTVHNNGICFDLPDKVVANWKLIGASLDSTKLKESAQRVRQRLNIKPIPEAVIGPGSFKFAEGANLLKQNGLDQGRIKSGPAWFELNFDGCVGCGYCNIGCRYGKKMSMLETFIPDAEAHGATVIANCKALRLDIQDGRAVGLRCTLDDQHDFYVHADYFVVACGTIASSLLLLNSGLKGPVGKGLSFNIGAAVSAEFPQPVRGYDGVQMCGYLEADGYMLETLFNPPALFAMAMPGWFMEHFYNMQRYAYLANGGVMVPSSAIGEVRTPLPVVGRYLPGFSYSLEKDASTYQALKDGIRLMAEVYLAAGAMRVMPSTYVDLEFRAGDDSAKIAQMIDEKIQRAEDVYVASAHPQGGNAINRDPDKGVINENMRSHTLQNVWVTDASVFPTSVQVNPQLSIMTVADYAAGMMLAEINS